MVLRRASGQEPRPAGGSGDGGAFSDVFATQVFKGGTPLLVEDGQVKLDVGASAQAEGLSVKWGLLKERAPPADDSEAARAERARRRAKAAEQLVNIDDDERARRLLVGNVLVVAAAVAAAVLLSINAPWPTRAALLPLVALAYGFRLSGEEGLWNIGQAGLWDVDGTGMRRIEDAGVAAALRAKVTDFNARGVAVPALVALAFVVLPLAAGWP